MSVFKNKKAFTLVEVIVVLVILAILAALLIPSMIGWINRSNARVCELYRGQTAHSFTAAFSEDAGERTGYSVKQLVTEAIQNLGYDFTVSGADDKPVIKGLCPSGGTISATYAGKGQIKLTCSVHGGSEASYETPAQIGEGLKSALVGNSAFSGMKSTYFYKDAPTSLSSAYYDKLLEAMPKELKSALAGKSWTILASAGMSSFKLLISDTDVSTLSDGKAISITVYDSSTGASSVKTGYTGSASDTSGTRHTVITSYYY